MILGCRHEITGPSGSFLSRSREVHEMQPNSQYCSWLITVAESFKVLLSFEELIVPNCQDKFLTIYDGTNDTAPLRGKFCGTNASKSIEILSSTNSLFLVANSGSYVTDPKSVFSFHAHYNAEHSTGWYVKLNMVHYFD